MAQKLAARNALVVLKEKERAEAKEKSEENGRKKNGSHTLTRQTLNDICLRKQWRMPQYRYVYEGGPAHAKRFTYSVRVNTTDKGWRDDCIGEPMPSVKKAKDCCSSSFGASKWMTGVYKLPFPLEVDKSLEGEVNRKIKDQGSV
ncbi:hypothetical protein IFM89_024648 [Coptis chinensis]|uniref:DRBM domain-containing protein n=1 Tax=Coptis chinensis TaxID=261450 RepID=A0A835MAQ0_9MAGN|nr:hypothetical protein IFM89_024648 [Coptis chinensis]